MSIKERSDRMKEIAGFVKQNIIKKKLSVDDKIKHLEKLGLSGDFTEIRKLYSGESFNSNDQIITNLLKLSEKLCKEYDETLYQISVAKSDKEKVYLTKKSKQILDAIFPGHGPFAGVCEGVRAVIGMVDCDKYVYINKDVHFAPFTQVHCGFNTLVAPFVRLGTVTERESPRGLQKVGKIDLEKNNWVCAGANFENDIVVKEGAVIGLGTVVRSGQVVESNVFVVNDPSETKFDLKGHKETVVENFRSEEELDRIIKFVESLGVNGNMTEYKNALNGKTYNTLDPVIVQIADLTHNLNREYNHKSTTKERKQEILDILFFGHGKNLRVGKGLFVDFIGQTKVGDNVKIGDSCYFGGNVTIGNNVVIGKSNCFAGIGHPLQMKGRNLHITRKGFYVASTIGKIEIGDNVEIGTQNLISPNTTIKNNIKDAKKVYGKKVNDKFDENANKSFIM